MPYWLQPASHVRMTVWSLHALLTTAYFDCNQHLKYNAVRVSMGVGGEGGGVSTEKRSAVKTLMWSYVRWGIQAVGHTNHAGVSDGIWQKAFSHISLLRFDPHKGFFCQVLSDSRNKCLGRGKGRTYEAMDEASASFLHHFYRKHNNNLSKLLTKLNYPVPSWLQETLADDDWGLPAQTGTFIACECGTSQLLPFMKPGAWLWDKKQQVKPWTGWLLWTEDLQHGGGAGLVKVMSASAKVRLVELLPWKLIPSLMVVVEWHSQMRCWCGQIAWVTLSTAVLMKTDSLSDTVNCSVDVDRQPEWHCPLQCWCRQPEWHSQLQCSGGRTVEWHSPLLCWCRQTAWVTFSTTTLMPTDCLSDTLSHSVDADRPLAWSGTGVVWMGIASASRVWTALWLGEKFGQQ